MRVHYIDNRYIWQSLGMLILLLSACSGNTEQALETITSATSTPPPTVPTFTRTATALPTQTKVVVTRTSVPTLPAEEADDRVLELLHTNANCSLPCWWGIVPGVTTTDEIQSILEPFLGAVGSEVRYEFSVTGGHLLMRPQPESGLRVGIQYLAKDKIVTMVYVNTVMTRNTYDLIYDDPFYQDIMSAYTLEAMLTKYGRPDQILIRSFSDLAGEFNPTQLLLFYPDRGIVVQYFSRNLPTLENEAFILWTCPSQSHISLRLFDPGSHLELSEILAIDDSFSKYKNISKATDMDIETFVQTYQEYNEYARDLNCPEFLKTPEDIWPNEYRNP